MLVSATQLKIKGITGLLLFIPMIWNIRKQLSAADGLVFVKYQGLRILSGWEDDASMRVFRNNGYHLDAMNKIKTIGQAKSVSWQAGSEPDWKEAIERLADVGF